MTDNLPQENINIIDTPQPVYEKKNNFIVILLTALLLLSITIASFFAYQTQRLVSELNSLQSKLTPVATVQPTSDALLSWETYTGKIFSFRYPKGMTLLKQQNIEDPSNSQNIGDSVSLSNGEYKLQVSSNFNGGWGGNPCLITKERIIDGHSSQLLLFGKPIGETDNCSDEYSGLVALIENKIFQHPYPVIVELQLQDSNKSADTELFDQILSTFKFVN